MVWIKVVLFFGWIIVSITEATRDAFFYHNRVSATSPDTHNIHWLFTLERAIVLSALCYINSVYFTTLNTIVFTSSLVLIFSFFHNGMYFTIRNYLNKAIYPKKWLDHSTTSTDKIELSVISRTVMMVVGMVGIISTFEFN